MNQDNYYCGGEYLHDDADFKQKVDQLNVANQMNDGDTLCDKNQSDAGAPQNASNQINEPIHGCMDQKSPYIFAVFDGMGGEECGEKASLIAAECVSKFRSSLRSIEDLVNYCKDANNEICRYAEENDVTSMGTTAAILGFTDKEILLCNIGDSKVFRFDGEMLEQISIDHYAVTSYGKKPPLSQNLGIPPTEMVIEPHLARGNYHDGDIYLICSDGLTDMVTVEEIRSILRETEFEKAIDKLLDVALEKGGRDNITIILCLVRKKKQRLFSWLFGSGNK